MSVNLTATQLPWPPCGVSNCLTLKVRNVYLNVFSLMDFHRGLVVRVIKQLAFWAPENTALVYMMNSAVSPMSSEG